MDESKITTNEPVVEIVLDDLGNTVVKTDDVKLSTDEDQTPEKAQEMMLSSKKEELSTIASAPIERIEENKPQRNEKGQFIQGNQEARGLENSGRPCEFCERPVEIMNKVNLYREYCRGNVDGKTHLPYLQELVSEDYLDITMDQFEDWVKSERHKKEHSELSRTVSKIMNRQQLNLLRLTMYNETYRGAALQLAANHGIVAITKEYQAGIKEEPIQYNINIVPKSKKQLEQENE